MQAMHYDKSVMITVGSDYTQLHSVRLTDRMRERCPRLGALPPGSSLPSVHLKAFNVILAFLDGDKTLSAFTSHFESDAFLLLFAQVWALAARLALSGLQNKLVCVMAELHAMFVEGGSNSHKQQPSVNEYLLPALLHLCKEAGPSSHAEDFLVCSVGRTAPLICELERQLDDARFDKHMKERILVEARSFEKNPIKHRPQRFLVSVSNPPQYQPLEVRQAYLSNEAEQAHDPRGPSDGSRHDEQSQETNTLILRNPEPDRPLRKSPLPRGSASIVRGKDRFYDGAEFVVCGNAPGQPGGSPDPGVESDDQELNDGSSRSSPQPPLPRPESLSECGRKAPYVIQVLQHDNNANNNSNHNGIRIKTVNGATLVQGRSGGTTEEFRKGKEGRYKPKLTRSKKGRRFTWFSLLTCGSYDY
jgi:hypothetical protein